GFVDRGEVRLAAGGAGATNELELRHADLLERDERELDERVTGKLLHAAQERAARAVAITLDGHDDVLLEADEIRAEQPLRRRDAPAGREAEARAHPELGAAEVVRAKRR